MLTQEGGDAAVEKAVGAAGSGASGLGDLAERHDDYLVERRALIFLDTLTAS